ncbi:MAG: very short patch repair endonuclease [Firmicutes bacterium]|nr:very short patch repair endonuclease [Bacillota bacterium]
MDNHSKQVRSYNMSQIKSKDSEPENIVRKFLFSKGFRYRKNVKDLPGKPDIVLKKFKTVIFVNGCFWHMHDCPEFVMPKSNEEYWIGKVNKNKMRDILNMENLKELGWKVIVIWECELKKDIRENTFSSLIKVIKDCPSNS